MLQSVELSAESDQGQRPTLDTNQAQRSIAVRITVDASDVVDAKVYLANCVGGLIDIATAAKSRADDVVGPTENPIPLWQKDPTPSLEKFARHASVQLAVFKAASELVLSGVVLQAGTQALWYPQTQWTTMAPGSGGASGGLTLADFQVYYPEKVFRPHWLNRDAVLSDGDLYVRTINAAGLNAGIAAALKERRITLSGCISSPQRNGG